MMNHLARLALILFLVSTACSMPIAAATTPATPRAVAQLMVKAGPDSTATPTPFQPVGPTSTPWPTATPTATPLPTETPVPEDPTETPVPTIDVESLPEGTISLVILGSDWRPNSGFRTDVMVLVSINARLGKVSAVSFPRDLYVTIPGWTTQRINTAFAHGGFSMLADTLETNFGVRPQYYIMTNFQGFVDIIDSLGDVNVAVGQTLTDKCDLPQAVNTYCTVDPGMAQMDGATALWYVRSRYSSSDFDRLRRAQEVLYGIFGKLMSLGVVSRLPDLYDSYRKNVETNLGINDILPLLPVASQILNNPDRIQRFTIGPGVVYPYWTPDGAAVLLPDYGAIYLIIQDAVFLTD